MKIKLARGMKNAFGLIIDAARAEPVLIKNDVHGVVLVIALKEYKRLTVRLSDERKTSELAAEAARK
jgi:PHD/YefM family antitoxin component YafN of YafNO toxin-antitoxin module